MTIGLVYCMINAGSAFSSGRPLSRYEIQVLRGNRESASALSLQEEIEMKETLSYQAYLKSCDSPRLA
ncbi:MAG TPA: hypothetical protein DDZ90_16330, partial [Planctomycetaceae bacterium]|nr:hypothetical protein [Planctomycetaceae bacterium]